MGKTEHLELLDRGVDAWNEWRKSTRGAPADLSGADLRHRDLDGCHLFDCDLSHAELSDARLERAELRGARVVGASLRETNLFRANLTGADFSGSDLTGATLSGAYILDTNFADASLRHAHFVKTPIIGARFAGADFDGAVFGRTSIAATDLSGAKNLEHVEHRAPSGIALDSIYASHGRVPALFLKGCGVAANVIEYLPSLTPEQAWEYYSCFISHSSVDRTFCDKLHEQMSTAGIRNWYAPHDLAGGQRVYDQVLHAIHSHERLILVLSADSMTSEWVVSEILEARRREKASGRRLLFPIALVPFRSIEAWSRFDTDAGTDVARTVREYFIPSFVGWESPEIFGGAFARLLRDLKKAE